MTDIFVNPFLWN